MVDCVSPQGEQALPRNAQIELDCSPAAPLFTEAAETYSKDARAGTVAGTRGSETPSGQAYPFLLDYLESLRNNDVPDTAIG